MTLPLDSPRWLELTTDGTPRRQILEVLRQAQASHDFGRDGLWQDLLSGALIHQGTIYEVTYAAVPYLVQALATADPAITSDLWIDLGFVAGSALSRHAPPVPPDLASGWAGALAVARNGSVDSFLAAELEDSSAGYHAMACVAFAGHPVGPMIWELMSVHSGGELAARCPHCHDLLDLPLDDLSGYEPEKYPDLPAHTREVVAGRTGTPAAPAWSALAQAIEELGSAAAVGTEGATVPVPAVLPVASAGLPPNTPARSVLWLAAAMAAVKGAPSVAGTVLKLSGRFACPSCGQASDFTDALD
jgi:hypothetical protein